jgi:CDP-glycerol glycerophosphotransferase
MPRVSVVVPIYRVEAYLAECLASIAGQTMRDLEVIMVDDGSPDDSAAIARDFAGEDGRFRLISQPNGGLGRARNTGVEVASGQYLAFVDSDDTLPRDAYERLLDSLDSTGSDFASGNVLRLAGGVTTQAAFLARTFARTRPRAHVTRFRDLLADRTACNKLWRRSFWDRHALRFPEGVVHEDIPVVLRAHFEARSVDVLAAPVYHYRTRDGAEPSITQRRHEPRVLLDRLAAVEQVVAYLADSGRHAAKGWYQASLVRDDLRLHLDLLDIAGEAYAEVFVARANALLDDVDPKVFDGLPAIDRLKWHLVRRARVGELIEVVRFHRERAAATPPLRRGLRHYGDYPFRTDPQLAIPRSVFRLGRADQELALTARLDELRHEGETVVVRGRAHINGLGARSRRSQRIRIGALRPGRWRRIRMRLAPLWLRTRPEHCPDAPEAVAWAGFEATLDASALRRGRHWEDGTWELYAYVRTGLVRRRRARFVVEPPPAPALAVIGPERVAVRAAAGADGRATLQVRPSWVRVEGHELVDGRRLVLSGSARPALPGAATLEVVRRVDGLTLTYPLTVRGHRAVARFETGIVLAELPLGPGPLESEWELWAVRGERRIRLSLPAEVPPTSWRCLDGDVALQATPTGDALLLTRPRTARSVPGRLAPAARDVLTAP